MQRIPGCPFGLHCDPVGQHHCPQSTGAVGGQTDRVMWFGIVIAGAGALAVGVGAGAGGGVGAGAGAGGGAAGW